MEHFAQEAMQKHSMFSKKHVPQSVGPIAPSVKRFLAQAHFWVQKIVTRGLQTVSITRKFVILAFSCILQILELFG